MKILCVDPGPERSGFAVLDTDSWEIGEHGTADWDDLLSYVVEVQGFAVEKAVMYTFPGGKVNNKQVGMTIFQTGRLYQVAQIYGKEYREEIRSEIIRGLTGKRPGGKNNKTTKADMQQVVQDLLNLEKFVRPQHANDALCAGLYLWKHPDLPEAANGKTKKKKTRRRKSKAK